MALSRGVPSRPQAFVAQADAQPFAALLDAAVAPVPDNGAGAPAASGQSPQPKPANTGGAAQDSAAASPSAASAGSATQGSGAPDNSAPAQSGDASATHGAAADETGDHQPVPAPDANVSLNLARAAPANGMPVQIANADGAHQITAKTGGDRKPGVRLDTAVTNEPVITMPSPLRGLAGKPNASSATSANPTRDGAGPFGNDPEPAAAADVSKNTPDNTAAVLVAAVLADFKGAASADTGTPGASKPSADGKDDQQDQENGSADAATASSAASGAQLPSPAPAQPLAAAVMVNAASDAAPPAAAKPGLAIAEAVKARVKVMLTPAASGQAAPAQNDTAEAPAPDSNSAVESGGPAVSSASSGSDDAVGDAAAGNAQQTADQLQTSGTNSAAWLAQIDFASLGGTEHFSWRGETAVSLNVVAGSGGPNAIANAATAPTFGVFGPSSIAAPIAVPPAAGPEPAVPLAGLAVAIAGRAQAGSSQFDIRLDPPELGRIDVRLDVDGSGQVRTHVTVDRPDTLQLLQSQQPQLERALEQAGLKTADNGLQFTLRDQSFAGQNGGAGGQHYANQPAAPLVIPDVDAAPIDTAQIYARLRLGNGLDISV